MSPITRNSNEVDELQGQLRHALKREAAPDSLASGVEARMNGADAPRAVLEPHFLWNPVVDEPVWRTWLTDLRGMFQREHLPPLVLTSVPVAVPDPFRVKRSPLSSALSVGAHVAIIGLIIFLIIEARMHPKVAPPKQMAAVDITPFRPIAPKGPAMGGGGGGGAHELVQAPKGRLPKFSETPITPPMLAVNEHPKLAVEPTIKMPPNVVLPNNNLP
ncbi:MAG TPA: hypothetical protein VGM02_04185, partial [Acidobacteriaceae bacterium]